MDLPQLELALHRALDEVMRDQHRALARLLGETAEKVARAMQVDSAQVYDQFERDHRIEWLIDVHRAPPIDRRNPRALALRSAMTKAALEVRRKERHKRDPLYAHLEQKYRRLAIAANGMWIVRSVVGRDGVDSPGSARGDRNLVAVAPSALPPLPRLAAARYVSRSDTEHAAFMRDCITAAGGPLAHRQIVRLFLDAHGAARPYLHRDQSFDDHAHELSDEPDTRETP
jgi:hypothetical protein